MAAQAAQVAFLAEVRAESPPGARAAQTAAWEAREAFPPGELEELVGEQEAQCPF